MNKTTSPILGLTLAALLALSAFSRTPARGTTTTLFNFTGTVSDGWSPYGSLTLSGSKLYGMTEKGGGSNRGTVFSLNANGTGFSLLHSFTGSPSDGADPDGSLLLVGSKLYGLTADGGSMGFGSLFSMNTDGTGFSLLHSFSGGASDGTYPHDSLTLSGSRLYGMTSAGGGSGDGGTVFGLNTDGTGFSLLHTFTGADGATPTYGSLTLSGSKLYGTTETGGSTGGGGTVFSLNTDGTGFSLLHSFAPGGSAGAFPLGSLTVSGTKLYGMTDLGGISEQGVLFGMNTNGTGFSVLHSFTGGSTDGAGPSGSLTLTGSTLYGMTANGGGGNFGTLFRIGSNGSGFALLDSFHNSDGAYPTGDLTLSGDGSTFYGMTLQGGVNGYGVVFSRSLSVPEPGSACLLLAGFAGMAQRRSRR